jgi:serine/threonine-protein kinase
MLVGQQLGPYAIEKELGSGAMGSVFRARDTASGKRVAVKIVAANLSGSDKALARFEREASILQQLRHPNIVRLYSHGRFRNIRYYAMEFVNGESLDKVMARRGRMSWEEVIALGKQLCSALHHAHDKGIIHRDLKPSNLMVLPNGTVKLTDFGIAKDLDEKELTSANCTVGTAAYMAPEQCRGERELTAKCDLYSMGILFYELVTGRKPFQAETPMDMFLLHVQGAFERPSRLVLDLPVWFDTLICQLLEKQPEQRPLSAAAVEEALKQIEEKVQAQKSAGVDMVHSRVANRPKAREELDDEDREAARTLLGKRRKKRRRSSGVHFYHQIWFKAVLFSVLLAGAFYALYLVFFQRPSPEKLHRKAKSLLTSTEPEDWDDARKGPIADYLKYYRQREDQQAGEMHLFADWVDLYNCERRILLWKKRAMNVSNETEGTARTALNQEEAGDIEGAQNSWESLWKENKDRKDPEMHSYGLLAAKRLGDLQLVSSRLKQWQALAGSPGSAKTNDKDDRAAVRAVRYDRFGDVWKARDLWQKLQTDLRTRYDPDVTPLFEMYSRAINSWLELPDDRRPRTDPKYFLGQTKHADLRSRYLTATWRWAVTKEKAGGGKDESRERRQLIEKKLAEAKKLREKRQSRKARVIYQEVVELYLKDSDKDVADRAEGARKELKKFSQP